MCFHQDANLTLSQKQVVILTAVIFLGTISYMVSFNYLNIWQREGFSTMRPSFVWNSILKSISLSHVVENESCSLWVYPSEFKTYDNPRIKLDPNRFLYSGMTWGPNNQIVGLIETAFIAIKLNR